MILTLFESTVQLFCLALILPISCLSDFEYRASSFGRQFEVSTARLFKLSDEKPPDLTVNVESENRIVRYGQFDYGDSAGRQVAILVCESATNKDFELFVDLDRDRVVVPEEKVAGEGRNRILKLSAIPDQSDSLRTVRFRRSNTSDGFSIQTQGGIEGICQLAEKVVAVRRIDGDGNGLFADAKDQIWIDLNGDKKWNRISERFPYQLALRLDANRYVVRGDSLGSNFRLKPVDGEGELGVDLNLAMPDIDVESFRLTLFGDDGSSFRIQSLKPQKMPVGKYKVGSLSLLIRSVAANKSWYFSFSHSGRDGEGDWIDVAKDERTTVNPLGDLEFGISGDKLFAPGTAITVRPFLVTETKLYLRSSGTEKPDDFGEVTGNNSIIDVTDSSGNLLSQTTSGFR